MFSNLTNGSILYGLDTREDMKAFAAPITSVSLPRPKNLTTTFGQLPEMVVDIIVTINGEKREFKQIPAATSIANFGSDTFVLADSKEALNNHITAMLQNSKNIVANIDKHKRLIEQYENVYNELNPNFSNKDNEAAVKSLQEQVTALQSQLSEAIDLIKSGNNKET